MKRILFVLVLFLTASVGVYGQDVIYLKNGDSINCKITKEDDANVHFNKVYNDREVNTFIGWENIESVKYKKENNATAEDGVITVKKQGMGSLFYTGEKQLNIDELSALLKTNKESNDLMETAKGNNTLAMILGGIGGGLIGWPLGTAMGGGKPVWAMLGVGVVFVGVSIPISITANSQMTKAVEIYNTGKKTSFRDKELKIGVGNGGFGLCLRF